MPASKERGSGHTARAASPYLSTLAWPYFAQSRAVHAFWYRYARFKRTGERARCPYGLPLLVLPLLGRILLSPARFTYSGNGMPASREQGSGHTARTASLSTSLLDRMLASPARIANLGIQVQPSTVRGRAACTASTSLLYIADSRAALSF
jgi:hypothetical protein